MDNQINLPDQPNGLPQGYMTFNKNTDCRTDLYDSLYMKKGSWWFDPTFGLQSISKITASNILSFQQNIESALAWMVNAGRASTIDVTVEQDIQNMNQLDVLINITQPNGFIVAYHQYYRVGGPGPNFVLP